MAKGPFNVQTLKRSQAKRTLPTAGRQHDPFPAPEVWSLQAPTEVTR